MVPMPPPPDLSSRPGARLPRLPTAPAPHANAPVHPRPGQLTAGWRWVMLLGWGAVVIGLMAVGGAGDLLGKQPWWLDGPRLVVPFAVPAAATLLAFINARPAVWIGFAGVVSLTVTALLDRHDSPGVAVTTAVLAMIGLLTTVSCLAGRMPRPRPRD
jgi:hypothetical protein